MFFAGKLLKKKIIVPVGIADRGPHDEGQQWPENPRARFDARRQIQLRDFGWILG